MEIQCDLCGGYEFTKIYEFTDWFLYECNNCRLRFGLSDNCNDHKNIYNRSYYNSFDARKIGYSDYLKAKEIKVITFKKWFNIIESIIPVGCHLDVGCAFGYSVEIALKKGWDSEGIDISPYATNMSENHLSDKIYCADILSYSNKKKYDLITAWDVLEHVSSPNKFFLKVSSLLKNNGILALTTPDSNSNIGKLFGKNWFEYKWPEHRFYLNRKTLLAYCKKYHLKVIKIKYAVKYKTLGDALFRWFGMYENKSAFQNCLKMIIPYSSFSETFLIAQKK